MNAPRLAAAIALVLALNAPAGAKPDIQSVISRASSLVDSQQNKDLLEVRALDVQLNSLGSEVVAIGWKDSVGPLSAAVFDARRPLKLRLWLAAYLQRLRDPSTFASFKKLALDPGCPDLLREAAIGALAANPVSRRARRTALCAVLDSEPGPRALDAALLEVDALGCEDPAPLVRWALAYGSAPKGAEQERSARAVAALGTSQPPSAVSALETLYDRFERGSPGRLKALEGLLAHAAQLRLEPGRWSARAAQMLTDEDGHAATTAAALRLLAAVGDPAQAALAARFLKDKDGAVVVAAAETLATLGARDQRDALAALLEAYPQDERFAAGPGRDPVGWYERIGAALKALR